MRLSVFHLLSTGLLATTVQARPSSIRTGTITSTSVNDESSGSQGQTGSVGSTSSGSAVGAVGDEVGVKHMLHFSDVHLDISDSNESAEIPIEYGYDAPISLLKSALQYAQQVLPNPDFFLYTGDYAASNDSSEESVAEAVKVTVQTMTQYFPDLLLNTIAILGDADTSPAYSMNITDPDTEDNPSIVAVSGAWNNSISEDNLKYFNAHGYLAYAVDEKLLVLTLNTVPYSPKHTPNSTDEVDPFGQFQWLNDTLETLRNSSRFAYIVGHIPPIIDSQDGSPMWEENYITTYKNIVTKYADVIKAQIFGHTHSIEFRLPLTADMESEEPEDVVTADNVSSSNSSLVPLFMSAAISPIFYNNPAFLVWDYHATTYELLDFTVYGANISHSELSWQQLFKASTAYNVSSLSWTDMNSFIVAAADDSVLVEQYYYNSQAQSYLQHACENSVCLTWYLCSMLWWSTPEDYTACLAAGSRLEVSAASPLLSSFGLAVYTFTALFAMVV